MKYAQELLRNAYRVAAYYSDNPRTQNGAVLVNRNGQPIGTGANSYPNGVLNKPDRLERPKIYTFLEHAERNAIFSAACKGEEIAGGTLYCPWYACADCARAIIQTGIVRVIGHKQMFDRTPDRWKETIAYGDEMLKEAGVEALQYDGLIGDCTGLFDGEIWNP